MVHSYLDLGKMRVAERLTIEEDIPLLRFLLLNHYGFQDKSDSRLTHGGSQAFGHGQGEPGA